MPRDMAGNDHKGSLCCSSPSAGLVVRATDTVVVAQAIPRGPSHRTGHPWSPKTQGATD